MAETSIASDPVERPIVFFDGVCRLCNRAVEFLLKVDRRGVLRFASIQGEAAKRWLPPLAREPESWAIVVVDPTGIYDASDAVLRICRLLGGGWSILAWFGIVPRAWRDIAYRWVARNRYGWFGRRESCRLPTAEERVRFLD